MQPEGILKLLESNDKGQRLKGVSAYYEFLVTSKDDGSDLKEEKNNNNSVYKNTKLWKTIRRRTWNHDEADEIIIQFFEYIMRRFKTGDKILSHEELAKEKKAPVINNLEAFAFWKCGLLITDLERKIAKQKEREVVTEMFESLGQPVDEVKIFSFEGRDNKQQLMQECLKRKLQQFGKEVSADGAEAIGMQMNKIPIKAIAKWQKRKVGTQREFIRASKEKAKSYFAPCYEILIKD
jgi:hypothetical protein